MARNPHKMTAYFGDGDKDDVRIFTPAGQLLGAAKPADSSLGGANNVAALHWTPSEMLVVVREDGAVDTFNLHGEREGEAFPLSSALGGYLVLHTAMSGYTLAAVLVPGALSGQGTASGPELVVVPDVRRPSTRESSDLGLLGGGAPTSMTLLGALHAPSRKAEVIMSTTSSSLLVASAPHYEPEDQRLQQVFGTPILDLAVSPSGRLLAGFGENGILFVVTTDMRKKVLQFDTQCSARGMPPPHQLLWVGGSPARITADANEALDFAVALVWHENGIVMVNPHTGEDAKVDVVEPLFAVQEVDCLRFFTSENHSMVQQVPPSIVNVLSISSESPARLLRDASTDFARRDAACDDDIRYLQSEGHLHDAVLDCIDGAVRHWLPERQKELLRAASYGKRFDVDFSAEVLTTAVKCLRTLNQLRSPEVAMPLTARQFDILTPEAVLGRLLLRSQHALALGMAEYWPLPALRSRVVEHWACAKIRREACVRPHKAITDEISSRLREARLTSCPYSKAAYSLGEGSASRSSGLAVSYADMAAAAQAVGQQELATSLLKLEPRAAEQVPLLLQMGAGAEALQRALESGDMDLVYLSLLHLKQSMSLQAGHVGPEGQPISGEEAFINLTLRSHRAAQLLVRYATHQDPDLAARMHAARSDFMQAARASLIMAFDQPPSADNPDDRIRESVLRREAGVVPGGEAAAEAEEAGIANAADMLRRGADAGQKPLGFFAAVADQARALRAVQHSIHDKHSVDVVGDSLVDTVAALLAAGDERLAGKVKADFKLSDRHFATTKLRVLTAMGRWEELLTWAKSRRSHAIPWKAFVDAAIAGHSPATAAELATKLPDLEDQFQVFMDVGFFSEAAGVAAKLKDAPRLQAVAQATTAPAVQSRVREALAALQ